MQWMARAEQDPKRQPRVINTATDFVKELLLGDHVEDSVEQLLLGTSEPPTLVVSDQSNPSNEIRPLYRNSLLVIV